MQRRMTIFHARSMQASHQHVTHTRKRPIKLSKMPSTYLADACPKRWSLPSAFKSPRGTRQTERRWWHPRFRQPAADNGLVLHSMTCRNGARNGAAGGLSGRPTQRFEAANRRREHVRLRPITERATFQVDLCKPHGRFTICEMARGMT